MAYKYVPYDEAHYMTNLRQRPGAQSLIWDGDGSIRSLVVQTPYGVSATDKIENILAALNSMQLSERDGFVEVIRGIWVAIVPRGTKSIAMHGRASTYTVFALSENQDSIEVHEPKFLAMQKPMCDLPLVLEVSTRRHTEKVGLFGNRTRETGFWEVAFFGDVDAAKNTTGLVYGFDTMPGFEIPIAPEALANRCFFVRSEIQPKVRSKAEGLKLQE